MSASCSRILDVSQSCSRVHDAGRLRDRGFTLIELMITLAVAVVLIMVAAPSFTSVTAANKLTTVANDVVGAISVARMEAVKSNTSAQLCGDTGTGTNGTDTLGAACTEIGQVYVLINGAASPVRAGTPGISAPITTGTTMVGVRFASSGLAHAVNSTTPYTGLVVDVSTSAISTDNHRCVNMTAGSIVAVTKSSAGCP